MIEPVEGCFYAVCYLLSESRTGDGAWLVYTNSLNPKGPPSFTLASTPYSSIASNQLPLPQIPVGLDGR